MSDGRKYYCICESNCKFETMTKEQILAAIAQAVETGSVGDVDTGFASGLSPRGHLERQAEFHASTQDEA